MNGIISIWICGLLYSAWCVVFGLSGLMSANTSRERSRSIGQVAQGVLLSFVVAGAYFRDSMALFSGGSVVICLLIIHAILGQTSVIEDIEPGEENPT